MIELQRCCSRPPILPCHRPPYYFVEFEFRHFIHAASCEMPPYFDRATIPRVTLANCHYRQRRATAEHYAAEQAFKINLIINELTSAEYH